MIDKNKSVARSRAGSALLTVSGIVLFFGIVATVILVIASIVSNDFYEIATVIEVLFGSIFVYVFGKTVAKLLTMQRQFINTRTRTISMIALLRQAPDLCRAKSYIQYGTGR